MRCIFCKTQSDECRSVEHIIPESLGNIEHILPRGWVCDACNNYIAVKIEKPFLDSPYGRNTRFFMQVPNKRGFVPPATAWHVQSRLKVDLFHSPEPGQLSMGVAPGEDETLWISSLQNNSHGTLIAPAADMPEQGHETSRFIGKIALEGLAARCMRIPGWNDELVDKPELDALRRYIRLGNSASVWPINMRKIYPADFQFVDSSRTSYEVLHEWDILGTSVGEYYFVVAIFGVEYAINFASPELSGYHEWLKTNGHQSYLISRPNT